MARRLWSMSLLAALLASASGALALDPNATVAQIRAEMARIRKTTNWDDPAAANAANEQVRRLAEQLKSAAAAPSHKDPAVAAPSSGPAPANAPAVPAPGSKEDLFQQMLSGAGKGSVDFAENVRAKVEADLAAEKDPQIKSQEFLDQLDALVIDFSEPGAKELADQLDRFKAIKTLILTGGKMGAPVSLDAVLRKASRLPLVSLGIIDFRGFVTVVPDTLGSFPLLRTLSITNNAVRQLPPSVARLTEIETLYVDVNPVSTVLPVVGGLGRLRTLGVARTGVSAAEIDVLRKRLPECEVLTR